MYLALLHKLKAALDEQKPIDEMQLNAHGTAYLALNAPRSIALGGINLFRKATGIEEHEKLNCNPSLVPAETSQDGETPEPLDKKYNTLLEAQHYALHAKDYKTVNMIAVHLSGYWESYSAPELLHTLDQKCFEYLCEHHPEKERFKARIIETIKQDPSEFFHKLSTNNQPGSAEAIAYLVRVYGEDMLKIITDPEVSTYAFGDTKSYQTAAQYFPPDLLRKHLAEDNIVYYEQHVLQSAAQNGNMPLLQIFAEAMQSADKASEYRHMVDQLIEGAGRYHQYEAYKLLKAIPRKQPSHFEQSLDGYVTDFIALPDQRRETIDRMIAHGSYSWQDRCWYPLEGNEKNEKLSKLTQAVLESGNSDAIRAVSEILPDQVVENLNGYPFRQSLVYAQDPHTQHPTLRKLRSVIDALDKPEFLDSMMKAIKGNMMWDRRDDEFAADQIELMLMAWHKLNDVQRREVLAYVPDDIRADLESDPSAKKLREAVAIHNNGYFGQEQHSLRKWEVYFDCADFVQELPQSVLNQSPYGFKIDVYKKLLPLMQMAVRIEGTGDAAEMAYKLTVLFQNERKAETYLKQFADRENPQAVHDMLLFDLPKNGEWDIEAWQQLVMRDGYGPKVARILGLASKIEDAYCQEHPGKRTKQLHGLRTLSVEQLYEYARKHGYARSHEHPELANLCISVGADEQSFNYSLEVLQHATTKRNMPDIAIDGEKIGLKGFRLRTLKPDDPVNLWIGKLVKCCNHIGGHTQANAVEQCTSPDVALYVVEKKIGDGWMPVAKVTGWLGQNGDKLIFNSWERLGTIYDRLCEPFLLAAGIEAIKQKPEVQEVRLGRNRGSANFVAVPDREPPRDDKLLWYDAGQDMEGVIVTGQHEVATREKLKLAETKLEQLTKRSKRQDHPDTLPMQTHAEQVQIPRYDPSVMTRAG